MVFYLKFKNSYYSELAVHYPVRFDKTKFILQFWKILMNKFGETPVCMGAVKAKLRGQT